MNIHAPMSVQMWFTAQEMADAAEQGLLPGIPTSKRGINDLADREKWSQYHALVRPRGGREGGGGNEYHIDVLPLDVRLCYMQNFIKVDDDDLRISGAIDANLSERARQERGARIIVVRLADRYKRLNGMTVRASDHLFVEAFNHNRVEDLPEWVRKTIGSLSLRSLHRWRSKSRNNDGLTLAYDPSESRKGTGLLEIANNGEVRRHILAWVADAPGMSIKVIRNLVEYQFGRELTDQNGELRPLPEVRAFQYFVSQMRETEKAVILAHSNPDAFRSRMKLVGTGAYRHVTRINQMWMIDASPVDALCVDGRWTMYACIDVATRRYIITYSKTPRSEAVCLLIRRAILEWGVPEVIKTDNGSDFVAVATMRLLDDLDIKPDASHAYSPAEKGIVERAIKTYQHEVAPQLPGYVGHNVAERKAVESKKSFSQRLGSDDRELFEVSLTIDELRIHTEDWLKYTYHENKHGGLKGHLKGLSPNDAAALSTDPVRRVDERALDVLLMPIAGRDGIRVVGHQGIQIDNLSYMPSNILVGTQVFCRHHPDDLGQIYVYTPDGRQFLDIAVCPEMSGQNPVEVAKLMMAKVNGLVAERKKELQADIRQIKKGPAAIVRSNEVNKRRAEERAAERANVIQLPKREEQHTTAALAAALDAVTIPQTSNEPKPLNEQAAAIHAALLREAEDRRAAKVVHLDPDAGLKPAARRFKWAIDLEARIAAGEEVSHETALELLRYQSTPAYQTNRDLLKGTGWTLEQVLLIAV